jgi:type IV pilus assembly protein PilM
VTAGLLGKNSCPIGIDIGAHSIKMLQLESNGAGFRAIAAACKDLPDDLPDNGEHRIEALADIIQQMLTTAPFSGRKVVSCLPESAIHYKNLRMPSMPPDELERAVMWEASDRLNMKTDTFHLQFYNAGEVMQGDETRQELILMAAPIEVVNDHIRLLQKCNLRPVAIDAAPSAHARCLTADQPVSPDAAASVILDVGYQATKVMILRNGRLSFFKMIDIGGRDFDRTVAQHLNLSLNDAADVRRRLQTQSSEDGDSQPLFGSTRRENVERAVYEAIRSAADEMAREVGLCLRYYSVTFRGKRPESAWLVGGEAHEPQLVKILKEKASINIQTANPLRNVELDRVDLNDVCGQWSVAAGLSMRSEPAKAVRSAA